MSEKFVCGINSFAAFMKKEKCKKDYQNFPKRKA